MAKIIEIPGNIFESSCQTIVNTVNCVGVMGKGIALEFKYRFPEMYESYVKLCKKRLLKPGFLHLWKKSRPWILNFPTKYYWMLPSKIEYIELGLKKFAQTYSKKGITSIAFPELGTSSGGLKWEDVKKIMCHHLEPLTNLDVEIYHFDPKARDSVFDKLYQKIHRFGLSDYEEYIGLNKRQAKLLMEAMQNSAIHTMLEVQKIDGIGEKSLKKIYAFVQQDKPEWIRYTLNEFEIYYFCYFSHIDNIENIIKYGILPLNEVKRRELKYKSLAEPGVQERRDKKEGVILTDGKPPYKLHKLVPLYLTPKTPTLYAIRKHQDNIFFLVIQPSILCDDEIKFAFSDGNAASKDTEFYNRLNKLNKIPWDIIKADSWDMIPGGRRKRCSEFLIYPRVPMNRILKFVVNNSKSKSHIDNIKIKYGIEIGTKIDPQYFF